MPLTEHTPSDAPPEAGLAPPALLGLQPCREGAINEASKGARQPPAGSCPPAERPPCPRSLVLQALNAVPPLSELLLYRHDMLRGVTLKARDLAALSVALVARPEDLPAWWRELARQAAASWSFNSAPFLALGAGAASDDMNAAVAVVQAAVRADPARHEVIAAAEAWVYYCVTRREVRQHLKPAEWAGGQGDVRLYSKFDVLGLAHRKLGDGRAMFTAQHAAARQRAAAQAGQLRKGDARRVAVEAAFKAAGLLSVDTYSWSPDLKRHLKYGAGTLESLLCYFAVVQSW